jgi:hypothetical protein
LDHNFPGYVTYPNHNTVDVFFHQYGRRDNCVFATYNHFAMLLHFTGCSKNGTLLNDMVHQSSQPELPLWKKGPKEGDGHKTAPDKTKFSKGKTSKSANKRSVMSKVERKSHRGSITSSHLQRMSSSSKKSAELEAALKEVQCRTAELAEDHKVNVEELDLPVNWFKEHEMSKGTSAEVTVVKVTQLTPHQCHCTWFPHSFIFFMFLHPCMGTKDVDYTCKVTGVKENTLFPWKKFGLIWDKHSSHYCDEVLNFIHKNNKDPKKATIISALVDEGLTPIIQMPDVAVTKNFKQKLKDRYYQHRLQLNVEQGVKVKVTREKVVDFILESIKDINQKSMKDLSIPDALKFCGLNSCSTQNSLLAFKNHMDELENNNVLKSMMLRNQKAVELN